jgi:PAS domain S-box-containing protein
VELVFGRVESQTVEEPAELLATALHVPDEDSAASARVHRHWNPSRVQSFASRRRIGGSICQTPTEDIPTQRSEPSRSSWAGASEPGPRPKSRGISFLAGALITLIGAAFLFGWESYVALSKSLFPTLLTMTANSALGFALAGLGLWLGANQQARRWQRWGARLCGIAVCALGAITLFQDVFGVDFGIDHLLYDEIGPSSAVAVPNRMSANSALAFVCAGLSVTLLDVQTRRGSVPSQVFAIGILLIGLEALIGYLYGLHFLYYGIAPHTGMPLVSAVLFLWLGVAALVARPQRGLIEPIMKESSAGSLARRLLLVAVAVPLAVGAVQNIGLRADLFSAELGAAILVVAIMLLLTGFIWFHARQLDRAESQARDARAEQVRLASRERAASLRAQLADRRLRDIVRGLEAVVWEADAETLRIRFVSDPVVKVLGYPSERWRSNPDFWLTLVHPEDRTRVLATCRSAAAAGREHEMEYRALAASGQTLWLRHSFSVVKDSAGRPIFLRGLITDVTVAKQLERRQWCQHSVTAVLAEAATLREAATRILQAVGECLDWPVGAIWGVDARSSRLHCVEVWHAPSTAIPEFEAASRQGSFSPGVGLRGRVWKSGEAAWIPDVAGDDNFPRAAFAAHAGLHAAFASPITLGKDVLGVMEFFSSEIRAPDADLLGMMTAIGNQVGQFIERKRAEAAVRSSEERLRFALEAARTWTWDIQLESGEVTWSENAPRVSGLAQDTSPANVLTTLESVHREDRERVAAAYADAIREGKLFDVEYRVLRHDGTERWVATRGRAQDERGKHARMLGVGTDITERKQIEVRLQEETETIERVNRIGQLLSAELDLQKLVQAVTDTATILTGARFGAFYYNVNPGGWRRVRSLCAGRHLARRVRELADAACRGAPRFNLSRRGRHPSRRRSQRSALRAGRAVPGDPVRSSAARSELSRRSGRVALGRGPFLGLYSLRIPTSACSASAKSASSSAWPRRRRSPWTTRVSTRPSAPRGPRRKRRTGRRTNSWRCSGTS